MSSRSCRGRDGDLHQLELAEAVFALMQQHANVLCAAARLCAFAVHLQHICEQQHTNVGESEPVTCKERIHQLLLPTKPKRRRVVLD